MMITALVAVSIALTYIFHEKIRTGAVFTHFFYIPIILAALWWRRKGIWVAVFLALFLTLSHQFLRDATETQNDYFRAVMFVLVGAFVAELSTTISRGERALREEKDKMVRLNSVLRAIRNVNQLITREKDSERLIQRACEILVETRGFSHAWIALLRDSRTITSIASAGLKEDFSDVVGKIHQGDLPRCAGYALSGPGVVYIEDPLSACPDCPLSREYRGWSSMVVRLESAGELYGILFVSIPPEIAGEEEEQSLLRELAEDIAFALRNIETETERAEAKAHLEREREKAQLYLDIAGVMFVVIISDGTVSLVNRKASEILGYPEEEIIGKNWFEHFIPERLRGEVRKVFNQLIDGEVEPAEYFENPILTHTGEERLIAWHNTILRDPDGKITGTLGSGTDITEQKHAETERERLERQIRQMQKLEAVGTLAGGVAHDFNNILGAIIGYTEMALEDVPADSPALRNLEQVIRAGQRGKNLVNQIITFSRQKEESQRPVPLTPIIEEALNLLRASIPRTIEIKQMFEAESDVVTADPTQIHQVLMNLGTNAAHAMRDRGGTLTVSIREEDLDEDSTASFPGLTPGPYLRVTVNDTGHGMERKVMDRIFDPYFTTKKPGEGSGMGLSVVLGIVRSHRGAITVYSEPGKGSAFHFLLPLLGKTSPEKEEISTSIPGESQRILFIDDEADLVDIARQMLSRLGFMVTATTSASEALELFRSDPTRFDLIITDQTMPEITGFELAREVLRIRPDIPLILSTGFSETISSDEAKAAGIREFIMKPISKRELIEVIHRALSPKA